jgi:hypothetical protein
MYQDCVTSVNGVVFVWPQQQQQQQQQQQWWQ